MARSEWRPEVPQHLAKEFKSAGAIEEDMRREYQIREKAWELGVPQASLEHPTVRGYVSVYRDVWAMESREADDDGMSGQEPPSNPASWQAKDVYAVAREVLEDQFHQRWPDRAEMALALKRIVEPAGGGVTSGEWDGYDQLPTRTRHPLWYAAMSEPYPASGRVAGQPQRRRGWWSSPDGLLERTDAEHRVALIAEAQRHDLPPATVNHDPMVRAGLTRLVYARSLADLSRAGDLPAVEGLVPSATTRLRAVQPMAELGVAILAQQFQPDRVSRADAAGALQPVARLFGFKIQ